MYSYEPVDPLEFWRSEASLQQTEQKQYQLVFGLFSAISFSLTITITLQKYFGKNHSWALMTSIKLPEANEIKYTEDLLIVAIETIFLRNGIHSLSFS